MKLKPEYALRYDEDDISLVRVGADGTEEFVTTLSLTAAMAIDGLSRGVDREAVIDSVTTEFDVADRALVAADLENLIRQLIALGYAEA